MFPEPVTIASVEMAIFEAIKLEAAGGLTHTLNLNRCLIQWMSKYGKDWNRETGKSDIAVWMPTFDESKR